MSIGSRLKQVRQEKQMSVIALSHSCDVAKETIWAIENGSCKWPHGYTIYQLCKTLRVSADHILGLQEVADEWNREPTTGSGIA